MEEADDVVGGVTLFGSYVSFQFLITQYPQVLAGWSAMATALAFLPAGVVVAAVLSTTMGGLLGRFGSARLTAVAFACLVAAYAVVLRAPPRTTPGSCCRRWCWWGRRSGSGSRR